MAENLASDPGDGSPPRQESRRVAQVLPPFDDPDADIIIRASDGVEFRACKYILTLVSPIFRGMFQVAGPPSQAPGLPVVDISEDSRILDLLLRLVYPGDDPAIATLEDTIALLKASRKYEIVLAERVSQKRYREIAAQRPTEAWVETTEATLPEEARYAARMSLRFPVFSAGDSDILDRVTAKAHYRFMAYHHNCAEAVQRLLVIWQPPTEALTACSGHDKCSGNTWIRTTRVWFTWLKTSVGPILKDVPSGKAISGLDMQDQCIRHTAQCENCLGTVFTESRAVLDNLAELIEEEVDKVPFTF